MMICTTECNLNINIHIRDYTLEAEYKTLIVKISKLIYYCEYFFFFHFPSRLNYIFKLITFNHVIGT